MRNKKILVFILLLSLPFFPVFANPCLSQARDLDRQSSSLNQKYELKEKLKKVFEESVEKELVVQAEGVVSPPEREKAKAIAETQGKLDRLILKQEDSFKDNVQKFCEQCRSNIELKRYCSYCRLNSHCQ